MGERGASRWMGKGQCNAEKNINEYFLWNKLDLIGWGMFSAEFCLDCNILCSSLCGLLWFLESIYNIISFP